MNKILAAYKKIFGFALPIVGQRLVIATNGFVGMLMIARLGHAQMAAGALVTSVYTMLFVIATSVIYSMGVIGGQLYGAKKYLELGKILRQTWLLAIIIAVPLILVMWNISPVLLLFKQDKHLVLLTQSYFHILSWGVLPLMILFTCSQFMVGVAKPTVSLCFSLASIVVTLAPAYCLVFGKLGLPAMGMTGVALAITMKNYIICIVALIYLLCSKYCKKFNVFNFSGEKSFYYLKRLLQVGVPISIQFAAELSAFCMGTFMMGWLGQTALAAWQIVLQLNVVAVMVPFGISQASGVLVGHAVGGQQFHQTRVLSYAAVSIGLFCALIIGAAYLIIPKVLIGFYINVNQLANARLVHIAVLLMAVGAFSQFFDASRNIATGALRGFHDTKVPMWIGILATWIVNLPVGYFCAFILNWGPVGLSCGFMLGVFIGAVLIIKRLHGKTRYVIS
ncbi:MAG: MATE family efflux transporter [Gammaproteobacteria bacterium]|jgi:MATE family multidrug resistance protein